MPRIASNICRGSERSFRTRPGFTSKKTIKTGCVLSAATLAVWLVPNTASAASTPILITQTSQLAIAFASGKLMGVPLSAAATLANGVLKVLGMQKIALAMTIFISMITGGSLLYGFLQDNPARFESGLRGTIVQIDHDQSPSLTLELDEYRTLVNLDLAKDVKVWIAYEEIASNRLKVGQFVSLKLDTDHRTIKEVHGQGSVREVTIRSVPNPGLLVVEGDDDNPESTPELIELAPETILRIGGMNAALEELKPGMTVPIEFGSDGNVVHAIETEAEASRIVEGELQAIDLSKNELILATETEDDRIIDRRLRFDTSVIARSKGRIIPLEDLRKGSVLKVRLDDDGRTIKE